MALTKITSAIIADGAITASAITNTSITADKLHTTLDLTGKAVTVATATAGDNDTTVASTAFVSTAISNLADSAPSTLNTLNELAAALGDDANFSTTVTNSIATKLPLSGGTMTGAIAASDFEVDASGDINLDAGGGDWRLKDDGTTIATISNVSGDLQILLGQDKDYKFVIDDNGSQSTALLLDGSEAGAATFNSSVNATNLLISGAQGSDGQVLTSTGSGVAWEDASGGGPTFKEGGTNFTDSIMIGDNATGTLSSATKNTALGVNVFASLTSGTNNVAIGYDALTANSTGGSNTSVGYKSLDANTTGASNTSVGKSAMGAATTGNNNTGLGAGALGAVTTGSNNTAVGTSAGGGTTASNNTSLGYAALTANTTGLSNTAVGSQALESNTTGSYSVAVGEIALRVNTTGQNVAIGQAAMIGNTTGTGNVAIGTYDNAQLQPLKTNTTGSHNVAIGSGSMSVATTSNDNTAVGYMSLRNLTTGTPNEAYGYRAGMSITTGASNSVFGSYAMDAASATGYGNTVIGHGAGRYLSTAIQNTLVGSAAGDSLNTGSGNVCIGYGAGHVFTTGGDNIYIGRNAGGSEYNAAVNRIVIGPDLNADGNNKVFIGKNGSAVSLNFSNTGSWSQSSDERKKQNIANDTLGLNFINDLRTVTYRWKSSADFPTDWLDYSEENTQDTDVVMHGMIAQEVKTALDNAGVTTFSGWHTQTDGMQMVSREMFILPLIRALQEADDKIDALTARIETLEG